MTSTSHDTTVPAITDLPGLTSTVFAIAGNALLINQAEARMQAEIEAMKKAFADATRQLKEANERDLAAVMAYCEAHKDELFPIKRGKRQKTFAVLQHKLQYRSSESVEAPADAADRITDLISEIRVKGVHALFTDDGEEQATEARLLADRLEQLLRKRDPELNKDAVKLLPAPQLAMLTEATGISIKQEESFKLALAFTPES